MVTQHDPLSYPASDPATDQGGERAAETSPPAPPPPPKIKNRPTDRTPGGNGYHPPADPVPKPDPKHVQAVGDMANALTDVTGISAKLNWREVGGLAEELIAAGYTPTQVKNHYGRRKVAALWHWYESDWRGKKGDKPRLKEIRETIAGAVYDQPSANYQQENGGQQWLEQSLALARANGLISEP